MIDLSVGGALNALVFVAAGVAAAALLQGWADSLESSIKGNGNGA